MQLNSISYIRIGGHIRSISKPREKQTNLLRWVWNMYQFALSKFVQLEPDPWEIVMARNNTFVCLQLVIDGKPL